MSGAGGGIIVTYEFNKKGVKLIKRHCNAGVLTEQNVTQMLLGIK